MAIQVDSDAKGTTLGTSITTGTVTPANSRRYMVVLVGLGTNGQVSSVTLNQTSSVSFSKLLGQAGGHDIEIWIADAEPTTQAATVTVNFSASQGIGACAFAVALSDVDITDLASAPASRSPIGVTGSASGQSVTLNSTTSGNLCLDVVSSEDSTPSVGAGQTAISTSPCVSADELVTGASTEPAGGNITMSWTGASGGAIGAVELVEDLGGGGGGQSSHILYYHQLNVYK